MLALTKGEGDKLNIKHATGQILYALEFFSCCYIFDTITFVL